MVTEHVNKSEPYVSTVHGFQFSEPDKLALQKLRWKLVKQLGETGIYRTNKRKGLKKMNPNVIMKVKALFKKIDKLSAVDYDHINEVFR